MNLKILTPGINLYENIFTDEECCHIIDQATPLLKASLVTGNKKGFISPGRISSNCWIPHNKSSVIKKICDKIASVTGTTLKKAEKMQVIYYGEGGKYNPHYDGWDHDNSEKQKRNMKFGGQRILTALVYLNDVMEGGGTVFPKKNITVHAKKGSMVVFKNCIEDTNIKDPESLHGGMPVLKGEKWAFNLWFREEETTKIMYQEFIPLFNEKLEEGDYVPFFSWIEFPENNTKHLHNFVDNKDIIIVIFNDNESLHNVEFIKQMSKSCNMVYLMKNEQNSLIIDKYFSHPDDTMFLYALNCERRIMKILHWNKNESIDTRSFPFQLQTYTTSHVPYIEIPNVFSETLLKEIITFYHANENRATLHNTETKHRLHIHPNAELEKKIDQKLRKTAYYKMKDVFNFEVKYRELYKICGYDHKSNGRFHSHRDTVPQYNHRVYGMSLLLNDDYEGGELEFSEYNIKLKPKANTAIIFPGTYSHTVLPVTQGKRMTIISFLCKEVENKTKNNPQYMVKN